MKRIARVIIIVSIFFVFTNEGKLHDPPPVYMGEIGGVRTWFMPSVAKNQAKLDSSIQNSYGRMRAIEEYIKWENDQYWKHKD